MIFPCETLPIACPGQGNLDYDAPIANLSSEAPDSPVFVSTQRTQSGSGGGGSTPEPNPGDNFRATECAMTCTSSVSQEDADTCAAQYAYLCIQHQTYPPTTPTGQTNGTNGQTFEPGPGEEHGEVGGREPGTQPTPVPEPVLLYPNDVQICASQCPDKTACSYTVPAGTYWSVNKAMANLVAKSTACFQAKEHCICLSKLGGEICVKDKFNGTINVTGQGTPPYSFAVTAGALPDGLSLTASGDTSADITGTVSSVGIFDFTVTATDVWGFTGKQSYEIVVVGIQPTGMPGGVVGQPYSCQMEFANAELPISFWVEGFLPPGLTMDANGLISGTPVIDGDFPFYVCASDGQGTQCCQYEDIIILPLPLLDCSKAVWNNQYNQFCGGLSLAQATGSGCTFSASASCVSCLWLQPCVEWPGGCMVPRPCTCNVWASATMTLAYKSGPLRVRMNMGGSWSGNGCSVAPYMDFTVYVNGSIIRCPIGTGAPVQGWGLNESPSGYFEHPFQPNFHWDFDLPDTGGATWTLAILIHVAVGGALYAGCSVSGGGMLSVLGTGSGC